VPDTRWFAAWFKGLLARIAELILNTTGTFWRSNGEVLPW
jgi:hypothetical protein